MNLLSIKAISEKKGVSIRSIAESIGMSEQNLHRCIRVNQIQAHQLEQITHILQVPIAYFFDEIIHDGNCIGAVSGNGNGNNVQQGHVNVIQDSQEKEIEYLRTLLEEKERTIQILMNK